MKKIVAMLVGMAKKEKLLTAAGGIGLLLGGGLALYMLWFGKIILPEGNVRSASSFNAAVGLFILTIAALLPFAGMYRRQRKKVRWILFSTVLISYTVETIQHLRGINPQFSQAGSVLDDVISAFFLVTTLIIISATIWIAIAFFRNNEQKDKHTFIISIRYAFVCVMLANASGLWMFALQGREIGETGNIIVLHGLGYHALQALPLTGFLLIKSGIQDTNTRRFVHVGSTAWLIMMMLVLGQTAMGLSIFELSLFSFFISLFLFIWFITLTCSLIKYIQHHFTYSTDTPPAP
ncbi:hypothetical protein [Alteribacillus bidgolensis]|uniref:DUF998 domain-containing protein n=1 Tax=Alteribacillus bidgolensis TaxID=930129 RepID=A0A1G8S7J2_9BACI|nr:hypothetical protein [Alteribacillus bidgolensis]SDJ25179.1 hypothetical protein SAMN05216352_1443 [Alteribacillus bidgolensis]